MASVNYTTDCPECYDKSTMVCEDNYRPYDQREGICLRCGFFYKKEQGVLPKTELDDKRRLYNFNTEQRAALSGGNLANRACKRSWIAAHKPTSTSATHSAGMTRWSTVQRFTNRYPIKANPTLGKPIMPNCLIIWRA